MRKNAILAQEVLRRKAKKKRDRRCRPSEETLQLLGWQLFILNVPVPVGDTPTMAQVYASRWRIEIIFKAWKSHFNLTDIPQEGSEPQILFCLYAKLLYIIFFHAFFDQVHRQFMGRDNPRISLFETGCIVGHFGLLAFVGASLLMNEAPVPEIIQRLCAYEKRRKRRDFLEKLSALS